MKCLECDNQIDDVEETAAYEDKICYYCFCAVEADVTQEEGADDYEGFLGAL